MEEYNEMQLRPRPTKAGKRGNPEATAQAILKIVDADKPPVRIFLGTMPLPLTKQRYQEKIAVWEQWNDISISAQGN
jgi:hypothetical protein